MYLKTKIGQIKSVYNFETQSKIGKDRNYLLVFHVKKKVIYT